MSWNLQSQSRIMRNDEVIYRSVLADIRYVDGKPIIEELRRDPIPANIQPMNGRDLLLVPEHERYQEQYFCFVPSPYTLNTGDVVYRGDVRFQVQNIEYWGSFLQARIMRVDVGRKQTP